MAIKAHTAASIAIADPDSQYTATDAEGAFSEARKAGIRSKTVTVAHTDLTEATNDVPQEFNVGTALPAGAVVLACDLNQTVVFDAVVTLDIGGTDPDAIIDGEAVGTGASVNRRSGMSGILRTGFFGGQQIKAKFIPDTGQNLAATSAGSIVITLWYVAAP